MKKRLKLIVTGVLAAVVAGVLVLQLVGCGKKGEAVDYAGRYVMSEATIDGITLDGDEFALNYPAESNYIEITDSANIIFVLRGKRVQTTYTREADVLHVNDAGEVVNFNFENGDIVYILSDDGDKLFFTLTEE